MAPTKKQRQIYEALLFLREKGEIPTVREIGALVGLNSPATVLKHLKALERDGLITMSGKSRGIRPTEAGAAAFAGDPAEMSDPRPKGVSPASAGIPVVGRIAAGRPIEAVAEADPSGAEASRFPELSIDRMLFVDSGELMALRVAGDSMIEAGILDGDFVIIRRQPTVEEGEIAAVDIDGDVTLQRWSASSSLGGAPLIRLIPANERFQPIRISESDRKQVRVLGKYIGLVSGDIHLA